jgi:hypothetical protein
MVKTSNARIWEDVYSIYRDVAFEQGVAVSSLMSAVLLVAAAECEPCVRYALEEVLRIVPHRAEEIARALQDRMLDLLSLVEEAQGAMIEEEKEAR